MPRDRSSRSAAESSNRPNGLASASTCPRRDGLNARHDAGLLWESRANRMKIRAAIPPIAPMSAFMDCLIERLALGRSLVWINGLRAIEGGRRLSGSRSGANGQGEGFDYTA